MQKEGDILALNSALTGLRPLPCTTMRSHRMEFAETWKRYHSLKQTVASVFIQVY